MRERSMIHIHPRDISGRKTRRRCRKENDGNVIIIDLDTEEFDNVIVIDVESFPKKRKGLSMQQEDKKHSFESVICIDDDDDDDDDEDDGGPNKNYSSIDAKHSSFSTEASIGRNCIPSTRNFEDIDTEVDGFGQKKVTPVKLSKCRRTYSGKAFTRNSHGLNTDSESGPSASDYPDFELLEDFSGEVQKDWEKSFRRKKGRDSGQCGMQYQSPTSSVSRDNYHPNVKKASNNPNTKPPFHPCTEKFGNEEAGPCSIHSVHAFVEGSKFQGKNTASASGCSRSHSDDKWKHSVPSCSPFPAAGDETCQTAFKDVEDVVPKYSIKKGYCQADILTVDEISLVSDLQFHKAKMHQDEGMPDSERGKEDDRQDSDNGNSRKIFESCMINDLEMSKGTDDYKRVVVDSINKGYHQADSHAVADIQIHEAKIQQDEDRSESTSGKEEHGCHSENDDSRTIVENCLIKEREMIKETDDYKRGMEEEWASRQRVLQIQAAEAQHLRRLQKRRTAESKRLSEMEKRQKQRVEEIRNTQKKDEEIMNSKEVIRMEVSREIRKLEVTCHSMASLLHSLGIHLDSWPNPVPSEVQAAYKRALLTFHPDRALYYDLQRQVEAEEKFKLINRFKQVFTW